MSVDNLSQQTATDPAASPTLSDLGSAYGYQRRDTEIVDYQLWKLLTPQTGFSLRGPRPQSLTPATYFTSLGAACTFGRFAACPYPQLLGEALGLSSLNLGFSGVGPSFYTDPDNRILIDFVNRSKFVTIAIFSGRSQSNSRFKAAAYSQEQYILENGKVVPADWAYQQLLASADQQTVLDVIAETRERYLQAFFHLLENITVPKVLLWFSKRSPDYTESCESLFKLFSSFPHMVNRSMVEALRSRCDAYVECVSTVGLPQPFVSRHTHQAVSIVRPRDYKQGKIQLSDSYLSCNNYYPSPEMHQAITRQLILACKPFA